MDNPEEMDRFLEKFSLPRLNQEEKEMKEAIVKILIKLKAVSLRR